MLTSRSKMTKVFLLFFFLPFCIISFQSCINDSNNNNTGFFYSGACPLKETPKLRDKSLCVSIYDCPSQFCSAGSGSGLQVIIEHRDKRENQLQCDRRLANLSLHACSFGVSKDAEIKSFDVMRENDGTNIIRLSMARGAIIEPEDNESADNNSDKGLRLVSFYSLRCGYRNENSLLTSRSLYKARLDDNRGSMIISDFGNITCGAVEEVGDEAKLECTYNIDLGCTFTLSLWGYDSRNNFSNRKTIEVRGN